MPHNFTTKQQDGKQNDRLGNPKSPQRRAFATEMAICVMKRRLLKNRRAGLPFRYNQVVEERVNTCSSFHIFKNVTRVALEITADL